MRHQPLFENRSQPAPPPLPTAIRGFRQRAGGARRGLQAVPAIVVRGSNGADLLEQDDVDERDGTFFGRMTLGAGSGIARTFSIHNAGTALLRIGGAALGGTGADEFTVLARPAPLVAPGGSTTLTIRYRGTREGTAAALVVISSNDPTERPYLFLVEACAEGAPRGQVQPSRF